MTVPTVNAKLVSLLKKFQWISECERDYRQQAKDNLEFFVSDQWDKSIRNKRESEYRPCLTINKTNPNVHQVTNAFRKNLPILEIIADRDDTVDIAEIINGKIRHIQDVSQAPIIYATASVAQAVAGRGYFRVCTRYQNDESFEQEIYLEAIPNSLAVYDDPACLSPNRLERRVLIIVSDLPIDDFEEQYPGAKAQADQGVLTSVGSELPDWYTRENVRIAEAFEVVESGRRKLFQLEDGSVVENVPKGYTAIREREIVDTKIMWYKFTASEILEEKEWPGKYIPVVIVPGEEVDVDGVRYSRGMVEDQKDSQRMLNYWASAATEAIALAPKAPWVCAEGQIAPYKHIWNSSNTTNYNFLPYVPVTIEGTLVPPPQRNVAEPPIQAMMQAMQMANEGMKATSGIYDASVGARSNETSGKAINARILQGDIANFHFVDNFANISLPALGYILLDLIPKIYDTAAEMALLKEDGTRIYKKINQPSGEFDKDNQEKVYDIQNTDYRKFGVTISTGPNYKTKRQQDAEGMSQLLSGNPDLWKIAGDLFVKAMDMPDAQIIADRIKKTLPPELRDDDPKKQQIPPQAKQELLKASQMVAQLSELVHQLQSEKEAKLVEVESKERIELEKLQHQLVLERMRQEGAANTALFTAELKAIGERLSLLSINQSPTAEGQPSMAPNPQPTPDM